MKTDDMNTLVQAIAAEVVRQLKGAATKPCALVLADRDCSLAEKVCDSLGEDYEFFFLGEDLMGRTPCRYVLPMLPCSAMATLVNGGATDAVTAQILKLLFQGVNIEVLAFEFESYAETMPGALFKTYQSHVEKLASYGLKAFEPQKPHTIFFRESLVTEAVVNDMAGVAELKVPGDALVTPAAYEAAEAINLKIQKES